MLKNVIYYLRGLAQIHQDGYHQTGRLVEGMQFAL
jgi:hypothetical protein